MKHSAWTLLAAALVACKPEPARAPITPEPDRIAIFEGNVHLENGDELAYRAILAPDPAAPGQHVGTVDVPMQALSGASLERIVWQANHRIEFALPLPGRPRWSGDINADGTIRCEFRQGGLRLACSMTDVSPTHDSAQALVER